MLYYVRTLSISGKRWFKRSTPIRTKLVKVCHG